MVNKKITGKKGKKGKGVKDIAKKMYSGVKTGLSKGI
jgi:hypothetical protein